MGVPHSELLEKQQTSSGASLSGGALRFEKAIIFKLECEKVMQMFATRLLTMKDF